MKFFIWTLLQCICSHSQLITIIYRFITRLIYFSLWPLLGSIRMPLVVFVEYHRKHLGVFFLSDPYPSPNTIRKLSDSAKIHSTQWQSHTGTRWAMKCVLWCRTETIHRVIRITWLKKEKKILSTNSTISTPHVQLYSSPCKREHECLTHICD